MPFEKIFNSSIIFFGHLIFSSPFVNSKISGGRLLGERVCQVFKIYFTFNSDSEANPKSINLAVTLV